MSSLQELHQLGQSTWLNYLRHSYIRSGELAEHVKMGIQGVTVNAQVYRRAIIGSTDYDAAIRKAVAEGKPARLIHETLMVDDIQRAADALLPVFEATNYYDGFVSYEMDPALLVDATSAIAGARHFSHLIDRHNVMVEIPATEAGIQAIRRLIADGFSVNATHLFSVTGYEQVAAAYIEGLAEYAESHSVWRIMPTAVASFSLKPIDAAIDPWLEKHGHPEWRGKTAIALAKILYSRFQQIFSGPEWDRLAAKGARALRPKWTRITPSEFEYGSLHYVNELIGPDTVVTFPQTVLNEFLQQGRAAETVTTGVEESEGLLEQLEASGLPLSTYLSRIQEEYYLNTDRWFESLVAAVIRKRDELDTHWRGMTTRLGALQPEVDEGLRSLCQQKIICRVWDHDYTVWKPEPTEITNRLDWLRVMDAMAEKAGRLTAFTNEIISEGYTHALLLGMGGSSLAPELYEKTFGRPSRPANLPFPYLDLIVIDTTDADAIRAAEAAVDLKKTLFIVSTKSGGTVETLSAFKYFYNQLSDEVGSEAAGRHFIGITDPGSKINEIGRQYGFRDVFINNPNIGGRYSALSYFGLVPAALVGTNITELLERASCSASNATVCHCDDIADNHAALVGTTMGKAALVGRDKITFIISAALASFGDWVEQLIAESTGKEGKGILPVAHEPHAPVETYGADRLFVHLRLEGDTGDDEFVSALASAGHPVITLRLKDLYDIGGQFLLWEMATAIAGYFLQINPFDQPNVEAAKVKAREIVADYAKKGSLPAGDFAPLNPTTLKQFLDQAKPGDYVSIHAYVQSTPETDVALQSLRQAIHLRTGLATTAGYGPRFLHSTGQLHKGDRGNGLFIQFVSDAAEDLPIPDEAGSATSSMSFNVLKKAQALGDAAALREVKRRVISFEVGSNAIGAIKELAAKL